MTDDEIRAIKVDCAALAVRLSMLVDAGRYDEALALYTDDAVHRSGVQRAEGKAALARSFAARPPARTTRHMFLGTDIEVESRMSARGLSYVLVFRHMAPGDRAPRYPLSMQAPETVGEYHDRFRMVHGQWRLAERRMVEIFDSRPELRSPGG